MDTAAHALTGLLLGQAAGEVDWRRRAFWALAAMAPDLDALAGAAGRMAYYDYHRAALHGLPGAVLLTLGLGCLFRRFPGGAWRAGAAIAGIAVASHLLLDTATSFGTELWFPFDRTPVYWDLVFMVDLVFSGLLCIFVGVPWLARRDARAWGRVGLAVVGAYLFAAAICRDRAESSVRAEQASARLPSGPVSILPQPPWIGSWAAFIRTDDAVWAGRVEMGAPGGPRLDRYPSPARDKLLEIAIATTAARRFLAFARFPHIARTDGPDSASFDFQDLRFSFSGWERSNRRFGVRVEVGRDGVVRYAGFTHPW